MRANYSYLRRHRDFVTLKDEGPWDKYKTITNHAEEVVWDLFRRGVVAGKKKIYYRDSEGEMTELIHDGNGNFINYSNGVPADVT